MCRLQQGTVVTLGGTGGGTLVCESISGLQFSLDSIDSTTLEDITHKKKCPTALVEAGTIDITAFDTGVIPTDLRAIRTLTITKTAIAGMAGDATVVIAGSGFLTNVTGPSFQVNATERRKVTLQFQFDGNPNLPTIGAT